MEPERLTKNNWLTPSVDDKTITLQIINFLCSSYLRDSGVVAPSVAR